MSIQIVGNAGRGVFCKYFMLYMYVGFPHFLLAFCSPDGPIIAISSLGLKYADIPLSIRFLCVPNIIPYIIVLHIIPLSQVNSQHTNFSLVLLCSPCVNTERNHYH